MERNQYADAGYRQPTVPAATPPVIDSNADPREAAQAASGEEGGHAPGSQPAHFQRGREDDVLFERSVEGQGGGDRDFPGEQPDEIVPDRGDSDVPERAPDEFAPGQGDFDRPAGSPDETPQPEVAPSETPPPPD